MEKNRIKRYDEKLEFLSQLIQNLKNWTSKLDLKEFQEKTDLLSQYGIFHAFQLVIETSLDLTAMVVKDRKHLPKDNYTNIDILERENIISKSSSKDLKESIGLRNRILHDYNGLDNSIAYKNLIKLTDSIINFKESILTWLKRIQ